MFTSFRTISDVVKESLPCPEEFQTNTAMNSSPNVVSPNIANVMVFEQVDTQLLRGVRLISA